MEKDSSSPPNSVHENKMKPCPVCKKVFSARKLTTHLKTHLPESERVKFKCSVDQCTKEYLSKSMLKRHFAAKHSSTPRIKFKCGQCSSEYSNNQSLKLHVKQIHSESVTRFGCNLCDASFTSKRGRDNHIVALHTGEKAFQCKECPAKFAAKSNLYCHQFVHTEERPRKCEICSKSFKQRQDLTQHVKRDHPQSTKDLQCSICHKTFLTEPRLNRHSKTHNPEVGKFCCYFCSNKFTKDYQERHLRTHTHEKPFSVPRIPANIHAQIEAD